MDPNNNQQPGTTPIPQGVPPVPPVQPTPQAQNPILSMSSVPKGKKSKTIILIVILILLVAGMVAYILFAKSQMDNAQKAITDNTNSVIPTSVATPTLSPEEDLEISSPEEDLSELDADVKGL